MRALVDIPEKQLHDLADICATEKVSRAEIIRRAISAYLENKKSESVDVFGLWKDRKVDGVPIRNRRAPNGKNPV